MTASRNQDSPSAPPAAPAPPRRPPAHVPFFEWQDGYLVPYLALMAVVSWCVPERFWLGALIGVERFLWRVRRQPGEGKRAVLERIGWFTAGIPGAVSAEDVVRGYSVYKHLDTLQLMRCHRPGGWHPRITLVGADRLRRALKPGRGVIVWVQPTATSDIVSKMALHRAGFRLSHLSHYTHGFSESRFGWRVLNPIHTSVERRFLGERMEMGPAGAFVEGEDGPERAVDAIASRLEAGGIVSIAITNVQAHKPRYLPLPKGFLPLGDGAIRLARRTGAALLPVVTLMQEDGSFVTTIEPALEVAGADDAGGDSGDEAAEAVLAAYGRMLAGHVGRAPEQFSFWYQAVESPGERVI